MEIFFLKKIENIDCYELVQYYEMSCKNEEE